MFIIQYWDSEQLPAEVAQAVQTFRERNPECRHLLFDQKTAEAFIEEHFTLREVRAFRACAVPSIQSDYLRYCALLVLDGVYADVDMHCVADLAPLVARVERAEFYRRPSRLIVTTNFFIVRTPRLPLLHFALEVATANIEQRSFDIAWLGTGPGIISTLCGLYECRSLEAYCQTLSGRRWPESELKKLAEIVAAHAGDRISTLLAGVQVSPIESRHDFVVGKSMAYQKQKRHWKNWVGSTYR